MTDPKGTWSDGGKVWNGEPMQGATICPHCHATVLSTSQPERMTAVDDPFNRKQVEAVCRAVCIVEGVDPDSDVYGDGCDPQWSRYADAVAAALAATPADDNAVLDSYADENQRLSDRIIELEAAAALGGETIVNCVRFVKWALQEGSWSGGDLDGGGIQDKAESLGLIIPVPYDPEKHGAYNEFGCDAGDPWFEFSPGLNAAAPPASPLRAAMKRIEAVCKDNAAASCDHKLALDFVLQIATAATPPEQPASPLRGRDSENLAQQLIDATKRSGVDTYTATLLWHASSLIDRLSASPPEQPAAQDQDSSALMPPRTET